MIFPTGSGDKRRKILVNIFMVLEGLGSRPGFEFLTESRAVPAEDAGRKRKAGGKEIGLQPRILGIDCAGLMLRENGNLFSRLRDGSLEI